MPNGILSAIRYFPEHRSKIEALLARDGEFRGLCDDLGDAENALSMWKASASNERRERIKEYENLVWELTSELREILDTVLVGPGRDWHGR